MDDRFLSRHRRGGLAAGVTRRCEKRKMAEALRYSTLGAVKDVRADAAGAWARALNAACPGYCAAPSARLRASSTRYGGALLIRGPH
jgi:hypothetical protein